MPLYHICLQKGLFVDIISLRPKQSQYHTIPTTCLCTEYCVGKNVEARFDLNTRIYITPSAHYSHTKAKNKRVAGRNYAQHIRSIGLFETNVIKHLWISEYLPSFSRVVCSFQGTAWYPNLVACNVPLHVDPWKWKGFEGWTIACLNVSIWKDRTWKNALFKFFGIVNILTTSWIMFESGRRAQEQHSSAKKGANRVSHQGMCYSWMRSEYSSEWLHTLHEPTSITILYKQEKHALMISINMIINCPIH